MRGRPGGTSGSTKLADSSSRCSATSTAASSSVHTIAARRPIRVAMRDISSTSCSAGSAPVVGSTKVPAEYADRAAGVPACSATV